jgi:hypothetical protein
MFLYLLHFVANISVIIAVSTAYFVIFKNRQFNMFSDVAFLGFEKPEYANRNKEPWYKPERFWRVSVLILGFGGTCYMLYGGFKGLFSWMPYSWRDEEGDWAALSMAGTFSFMGTMAIYSLFSKLGSMIRDKENLIKEVWFQYALRDGIRDFLTSSETQLRYQLNFCYLLAITSNMVDKYDLILTIIAKQRNLIGDNETSPKPNYSDELHGVLYTLNKKKGQELINADKLEKAFRTNEGPRSPSLDSGFSFDAGSYHVKLVKFAIWAELNGKIYALEEFLRNEARWYFR